REEVMSCDIAYGSCVLMGPYCSGKKGQTGVSSRHRRSNRFLGSRPLICVSRSGFRTAHPRADDDDSRARQNSERSSAKAWIKKGLTDGSLSYMVIYTTI